MQFSFILEMPHSFLSFDLYLYCVSPIPLFANILWDFVLGMSLMNKFDFYCL